MLWMILKHSFCWEASGMRKKLWDGDDEFEMGDEAENGECILLRRNHILVSIIIKKWILFEKI
mgnify:CR=1 FL=1